MRAGCWQAPPGCQQRLLHRVLGVVNRAEDPVAVQLQFTLIGADELAKRLIVSGPGQGRQVRGHLLSPLASSCASALVSQVQIPRGGKTGRARARSPGISGRRLAVRFEAVRILVLGGTSFVGRAIVEDALRTGAEVTLFGRGKTAPDLFPDLTRLTGDRDAGDYAALGTGSWDAVVDVSGYVPRHVGQAMDALDERAGRYLFISSHAVYTPEQEQAILARLDSGASGA